MGGVGKTELALQYALQYKDKYPGGVCWLKAKEADIGTQIIQLSALQPPKEFDLVAKVQYCWRNWRNEGKLLIVLDDIASFNRDYYQSKIDPYLPPPTEQFKVLLTSRQQPGRNIKTLDLKVLLPDAALKLLIALAGEERIVCDLGTKKDYPSELCEWLGYLPLGLELVGRYLYLHPTLTLAKTLERLEKQKLKAKALLDSKQADMTAQLGVAAAFDLSWTELSADAQMLGCYLSLFKAEPFDWTWVEAVYCQEEDETEREIEIEELEELRDLELLNLHLLKFNRDDENYQLHSLIAQYFRAKLEATDKAEEMKRAFCTPMIEIAQSIPETPILKDIERVRSAIPHIKTVATELIDFIENETLIWSFNSLARFYQSQGIYQQAEKWYEECLLYSRNYLAKDNPLLPVSLNNLAELYCSQAKYKEAELLYFQALEVSPQLREQQHLIVATIFNNIADLYYSQGKYEEAEPLHINALEMRKQLLGKRHPDVASSFNNLAKLYHSLGKYEASKLSLSEALKIREETLGKQHPDVATTLNDIAILYQSQGKYKKAESYYIQSLEIRKEMLGEQHPDIAQSFDNLGTLHHFQGNYIEAESFLIKALRIRKNIYGKKHPEVATSLNNLSQLYRSQGRYEEAKDKCTEALSINKQVFGELHPNVATVSNNLALLYCSLEKYEDAEPLYINALEIIKQLLGEQHPSIAFTLTNLAGLYKLQKKYKEAEDSYLKAIDIRKQALGEHHPDIIASFNNLAELYYSIEKYEDAEFLYFHSLIIAENVLGKNHPDTNTIRKNLNYTRATRLIQIPEEELKEIFPLEKFKQILQFKKEFFNNE